MKAKISGLFAFHGAEKNKTSDKMWLHVLCAAVLSFLPVLYFREIHWYDARYAFFGLVGYIALKFFSRDAFFHPVIVYSFVWMGAVMAIFFHLTIMPVFWLVGYYLIVVGWFAPQTEYTRARPKYTDEYIEKQMRMCLTLRPVFIILGVVLFAIGPSINF